MFQPPRLIATSVLLLIFVCAPVRAQLSQPLDSALRAIYADNAFAAEALVQPNWLGAGNRYTTVSPSGDIVAHDAASGSEETLVRATDLTYPGGGSLPIAAYAFSADQSRVLIFTNTRRVWRLNTRGDYWVFDRTSRTLQKLGGDAPPSSLMFAKFSPDGNRVAYFRSNDIYVEDVHKGNITRLTTDGGETVINGTGDWVNEEELFLRDAFRWSPDGRHIAYWQFDTSGVGQFTLINNTNQLYPETTRFAYPKAGTANSRVRVGIVRAEGGATLWLKQPEDPREHYIPRMTWLDAQTVAFLHTTRRQNSARLMLGRADTGNVEAVYGEHVDTWLDASDPLVMDAVRPVFWLSGGREFTWVSDKDGWRHVYAVDSGGKERLITNFPGDALSIVAVDDAGARLYFIASPDNATQRYLFAADVRTGTVRRLTPVSLPGTHTYDISPNGRWALHTYSTADVPPKTTLISLPDHAEVRQLVANDRLASAVRRFGALPTEFFTVNLGDVTLDGMAVKPASFTPTRKYPVVVFAYTEPAATTVDDRWAGNGGMFRRALAAEGYVVVAFENRGTPVPKGARWRKSVYGSLGDLSSQEQAGALQAFAAGRPWVDLDRVGIYGASGGGSATLNAMFRFPGLYKVGVAMAPGADQRLYDTIYQERYMGLPDENAEGYRKGSPINFAQGLRGRLLLMHGTADDNVHIQGTERLVNRLVELGKDFDVMIYPNRTHALAEGAGTTLHRWRTVARYLTNTCLPALSGLRLPEPRRRCDARRCRNDPATGLVCRCVESYRRRAAAR